MQSKFKSFTKWLKHEMVRSAICSAVFAAVFGLIIACGGGSSTPGIGTGPGVTGGGTTPSAALLKRVALHVKPGMGVYPPSNSGTVVSATIWGRMTNAFAMFFQTAPAPSKLGQSFQGSCTFPNGSAVSTGTSGFVGLNMPGYDVCGSTTAAGVGLDNPHPIGEMTFFDGTLNTLVVFATTVPSGSQVRCIDSTDTFAVTDTQLVRPYLNLSTNTVVLGIGTTALPLSCTLNVPAGDSIGTINAQWAKT